MSGIRVYLMHGINTIVRRGSYRVSYATEMLSYSVVGPFYTNGLKETMGITEPRTIILISISATVIQIAIWIMLYNVISIHFRAHVAIESDTVRDVWMRKSIGIDSELEANLEQVDQKYDGSCQDNRAESHVLNEKENNLYLSIFDDTFQLPFPGNVRLGAD